MASQEWPSAGLSWQGWLVQPRSPHASSHRCCERSDGWHSPDRSHARR